jgi:2-polyprenyl-3-methyl-5-hydroxy-6-metoxy-1,4-benzoquinol methylase
VSKKRRASPTGLGNDGIMRATAEGWKVFFAHSQYTQFASAVVPPEQTQAEVTQLIRLLGLRPGARVLDLGCGNGRIAVPLAAAGHAVTGLDACGPLLDVARDRAAASGVELPLIHAEMKDFSGIGQFDAVINLGTAFGYVERSEDDRAALQCAFRSLAPGGMFLLETENRDHKVRIGRQVWFEMAGGIVWCQRDYNPISGRWRERIEWMSNGTRDAVEYSLRLYTVAEFADMLADAGFVATQAWGGLSGKPYDLDTPRLAITARRP